VFIQTKNTRNDLLFASRFRSGINNGFKYTNGLLYFFQNNTFFEYNEITKRIVKSGEFQIEMVNTHCPNKEILK
jgi:hypothetical protein